MKRTILISFCMLANLSACIPIDDFKSVKTNTRYESVNFDGVEVTTTGGRGSFNKYYVILRVKSNERVYLFGDSLRVLCRDGLLSYQVDSDYEKYGSKPIPLKGEKIVVFGLSGYCFKGDTLTIWGPEILKKGEKYFSLDTMRFVMGGMR